MNCPNCDTKITCGCQKRKAADGTVVCSKCVDTYNSTLSIPAQPIVKQGSTAPSNVRVLYSPPRKIDSV